MPLPRPKRRRRLPGQRPPGAADRSRQATTRSKKAGAPKEEVLLEGWCQQFSSHSIGDLQFGPEGALYASGGDGASFNDRRLRPARGRRNPCGDPPGPPGTDAEPGRPTEGGALRSQNLKLLNGTILRVDPDTGEGLPGNPLLGQPATENAGGSSPRASATPSASPSTR